MRRVFLALALLCSLVTFATPASAAPVGTSTVHTYRVTLASMSNPAPRQNSTETFGRHRNSTSRVTWGRGGSVTPA